MPSPIASDIVSQALKKAGILGDGQTAGGGDLSDGLTDFGDMLALWNEKRWLVWHEIDTGVTSDGRITPYSVGPTGSFALSPRPSRIGAAYVRMLNQPGGLPVDTPLTVLESYEQFSRIALKTLVSFPKYVFLDTGFPNGQLYVYPWPNASLYQIHIVTKDSFPVSLSNNASFANYPPFTIPGMKFNLARILRQAYGKGLRPDGELNNLAQDALDTIRAAQVQVPELLMPKMLLGSPTIYNIFGDYSYVAAIIGLSSIFAKMLVFGLVA